MISNIRNAIYSYIALGRAIPDLPQRSNYIKSLVDKSDSQFTFRSGEKTTSIRSTVHALEALKALDELDEYLSRGSRISLQDFLARSEKEVSSQRHFQFNGEIKLSPVSVGTKE